MTLRESIGAYFTARSDRLGLMAEMFHATGAIKGLKSGVADPNELRSAVYTCLSCENAETCKTWLETAADGASAPSFCPNRPRLERLCAN
ncbi:DUF6455 family protein [Roseivivax sp. CAU 1753]